MRFSSRQTSLFQALLPIPIVAGLAALLLLAGCGGAPGNAAAEDALRAATTIRVHSPAGALYLRGDGGGLSWSASTPMQSAGGVFTWTSRDVTAHTQFKPMLDDGSWSRGPNFAVDPGATVEVWPRFGGDSGRVDRIDDWWSPSLQDNRPIWIYLPPSYDEQPDERFPVLYMHDGQNLFDPSYSFTGVTWNVDGALDQGAADGSVREAIVVGIGNTPDRIWEYTPSDGGYGGGGASDYLSFVVDELKPQIDRLYRTSTDRLDTAIIGSSLGGLVSACAGVWRPDVFGLVGELSPSTWWDNTMILGMVRGTAQSPVKPARVYVDSGDAGPSNDDMTNTATLAQAYRGVGWIAVDHLVGHGDTHTESSWARRLPGALQFLLGPRPAMP
jgi:predicted alpha/beta superfamily hydrolase